MTDEENDMKPSDPGKEIPEELDKHLQKILLGKDLKQFRDQLPVNFLADAAEGIHQIRDKRKLKDVMNQLNHQMHHQLGHKKTYRKRSEAGNLSSSYWAIAIVLILCIVGFLVIRIILHRH